jgi:chromosome segregation ATPase
MGKPTDKGSDSLMRKINELETENARLTEGWTASIKLAEQRQGEITELNLTVDFYKQRINHLMEETEQRQADERNLQLSFQHLGQEYEKLYAQVTELTNKLATVTTENECLDASCKAITEKLAAAQAVIHNINHNQESEPKEMI